MAELKETIQILNNGGSKRGSRRRASPPPRKRRQRRRNNRRNQRNSGKNRRRGNNQQRINQGRSIAASRGATYAPILSETMHTFLEAVVHPFGNDSIGAIIPDRFQELVIPTTDRLELDIAPSNFYVGLPPLENSGFNLVGMFMWFQPRCIASGILGRAIDKLAAPGHVTLQYPYISLDADFNPASQDVILNQYMLCITGLFDTPDGNQYGFYNGSQDPVENGVLNYYAVIGYSRFPNIESNCDKLRIAGAGLKAWSEESPINTGGYSVGGWATISDILENFRWYLDPGPTSPTPGTLTSIKENQQGQIRYRQESHPEEQKNQWTNRKRPKNPTIVGSAIPVNPAKVFGMINKIKFPCRTQGLKGSTVRYSCLQTGEQMQAQYPSIPQSMYITSNTTGIGGNFNDPALEMPEVNNNDELAVHDVITPGSYVPCIYWSYNTNTTSGLTEQYTIKVMSMCHSEGTPNGTSPFMSTKSSADPAMAIVKNMVENVDVFPVSSGGNSFKSFMSKTRHIMAKVAKVSGHITRLMAFADQFAATLG